MGEEEYIKMTVDGLALDPMTKTPVVVLKDERNEITLPIWIGLLEATSLATELEGVDMARPMTHDLLRSVVEEIGAVVRRVEVTELRDNTFYARILLMVGEQEHVLDSRPSDAISLALRTKSPIFVARAVLEASSVVSEERDTQDVSTVSPDQWEDILEKLDPSDFKYKM